MRLMLLTLLVSAGCRDKDNPATDSGDSEVDATGKAGAIGALEFYTLLGDYWGESARDYGSAWWGLVEPTDYHYWDLVGGVPDQCTTRVGFPRVTLYEVGVSSTVLFTGAVNLTMPVAEDGFFATNLEAGDYVPDASYDLVPLDGGELDGLSVSGIARTPGEFTLLTPNLGGAGAISLGPDELSFTWESAGADYVMILVQRRDPDDQSRLVEQVGCVAEDDGAFTIPEESWEGAWDSGQWIYVYVGPITESDAIVPLNGSDSRLVGISWQQGAARAR